jgi:pilus assembly protein FimV
LSIPDDFDVATSDDESEDLEDESADLEDESADLDDELPELDLADVSISNMDIDIDEASFIEEPADEESSGEPEMELAADDSASVSDADMDESSLDDVSDPSMAEISIEDVSVSSDDADDIEIDIDDEEVEGEASADAGSGDADVSPEKIAEDLEEADFYMEQGLLEEAEAAYSKILSIAPNHPQAMVRLGELASQRGDEPGPTAAASDPAPEVADSADTASEESAASDIGADLVDWEDEQPEADAQESDEDLMAAAESDLAADLGLEDSTDSGLESEIDPADMAAADDEGETGELPDVSVESDVSVEPDVSEESEVSGEPDVSMESIESAVPDVSDDDEVSVEPDISEEPDASKAPKSMEPPESSVETSSESSDDDGESSEGGDDFGFDLAAELTQSIDQDPDASASSVNASAAGRGDTSEDGFASVFAEFKKGVSETLTEGDHQAHYDLGIAYREMGLLNDAATEFQLAKEAPERRVGCLQLMGMCAHDLGEPEQAIGHFTEALASGDISDDLLVALKLDLGKSYEATGDVASARRSYEEVQAVDPGSADASARLAELAKPEDVEAQDEGSQETEEYETFAEFLGEHDESEADEAEAVAESASDTEAEPVWESFDDVVSEIEEDDAADSASGEPGRAAPESADTEPAAKTETTPKRRKKKISFV